jgi:hypothetical protein
MDNPDEELSDEEESDEEESDEEELSEEEESDEEESDEEELVYAEEWVDYKPSFDGGIEPTNNIICSVRDANGNVWNMFAMQNDENMTPYFLVRGINNDDPYLMTSEYVNLQTGVAFTSLRFSDDYECKGSVYNVEGISVPAPTLEEIVASQQS